MAINSNNFGSDLLPGLSTYVGHKYKDLDLGFKDIFEVMGSKLAFERDVMDGGLDLARKQVQGAEVQFDTMAEDFQKDYNHNVYSTAVRITRQAIDDGQSGHLMKTKGAKIARSMGHTKDIVCANVLNRAFNSAYAGGDAKELCATDHPTQGANVRNELATSSTLSEAALEQAILDIRDIRDTRGLRADISAKKLIVPDALMFESSRILDSIGQPNVFSNNVNAIKHGGFIPEGVKVYRRLTSATAWFIQTDAPDALKVYQRDGIEMSADNDFLTGDALFQARERYSTGWTDYRGIFGSPGTA